MRPQLSRLGASQRRLLLGVAVMAAIILLQGILGTLVTSRADAEAQKVYATSLVSIEQVSRIAHDIDQERILVNEHILENEPSAMAPIEARLADLKRDVREAQQRYAPLFILSGESQLWRKAQELDGRLEARIAEVLALSRVNQNAEARARLAAGQKNQMDLDSTLVDLIRMNLEGASRSMQSVRTLQQRAEALQWVTRIAGLSILVVFGVWGTRRIVRYEKQITEYALEIEERNRDLDAFAGRVAHDLRNALSPIVLSPDMLKAATGSPKQVERIADRIDRCSDRALGVVDSLLAFSRVGQAVGRDERGALVAAIRSVQEELAPQIARLGVSFVVEALPEVQVRCSPGLLHIVLSNLCGNAVKYLDGRPERRVHVSACTEDGFCRVDVEDTGPGIAKAMQVRIFEPFFRVTGTVPHGTGIGLATVRRVIEAREGRIEVHSALGYGCRFSVWLPLAPSVAQAASDRTQREANSR